MNDANAHRIHHAAIVVADIEASLRFWRDGLGFQLLMDETFEGDWKTLFGIDATKVRSVMVGDPSRAGSGIVEFVQFLGADVPPGFELLSLFVGDVDDTLSKLGDAAVELRRIEVDSPDGPVPMVTVRDPDGVLVEIIGPPQGR
ncbi:MAG TPA: VOC family protein [Acidimicrobiales bacterium]|nr:VOC family protein [Acidimicrobiales bacterium]